MSNSQRQKRWRERRAAARAILIQAGQGPALAESDRAKVMATAYANVERGRLEGKLNREARQAGQAALIAVLKAFLAHDKRAI